ncbi:hypothetical protein M0802_009746 [Mischocyttarus mexicanus]|nr:hypothetical protein M0802_009746 [Mischocyttarus mexicanus]
MLILERLRVCFKLWDAKYPSYRNVDGDPQRLSGLEENIAQIVESVHKAWLAVSCNLQMLELYPRNLAGTTIPKQTMGTFKWN